MPEQVTASVGEPTPIPPRPTFYAVAYLAAHHANSAGTWTLGYVNTVREIAEADARMRHGVLVTIPGSTQPTVQTRLSATDGAVSTVDLLATLDEVNKRADAGTGTHPCVCGHDVTRHYYSSDACAMHGCGCHEFRPTPKSDAGGEDIVVRLSWMLGDGNRSTVQDAMNTITTLRARIAELEGARP